MSNKAISNSDPNALEKLNAKLEACEKRQAQYERGQRLLPEVRHLQGLPRCIG